MISEKYIEDERLVYIRIASEHAVFFVDSLLRDPSKPDMERLFSYMYCKGAASACEELIKESGRSD